MLLRRGIVRPAPSLGLSRLVGSGPSTSTVTSTRHFAPAANARCGARQFGTSLQRTGDAIQRLQALRSTSIRPERSAASSHGVKLFPSRHVPLLFAPVQARHASTRPDPPSGSSKSPGSNGLSDGYNTDAYTDGFSSQAADLTDLHFGATTTTTSDLLHVTEQIGFLKNMGLEYGTGPTAVMEWLLEHAYIDFGLPWWGAITAVALLLRVLGFVPQLMAQENGQRMTELQLNPRFREAMDTMRNSFALGDQEAAMAARRDMMLMQRANNVSMWKAFLPLVQAPFAFGMWKLCGHMTALPVPGLETGGFLWMPDLTMADPYMILPIVNAATMWWVMKYSMTYASPSQQRSIKIMSLIFTPLVFFTILKANGAFQLFIAVTAFTHGAQIWMFNQPYFRRLFGLKPRPTAPAPTLGGASANTPGGLRWQAPRSTGTIDTTARPAEPPAKGGDLFSDVKGLVTSAKDTISERREKHRIKEEAARKAATEQQREMEDKEARLERLRRKGRR